MKLLIIGASGVLGARLYNDAIKKRWNVLGTYCSHEYEGLFHLDITNKKEIDKIFKFFEPEAVILAGGITDVDLCEIKPRLAEEVNIKGTLNVIKRVKTSGARFVFISTDYVFDGRSGPYSESDNPSPINVYGRTKLEAELAIKDILKDGLIVRTSQIYGFDPTGKNFTVKIIHNMKRHKNVLAAEDFYATPTYTGLLSEAIMALLERNIYGIYNVAGTDFVDRYSYVKIITEVFNLDISLIKKVTLDDLHLKANRPYKAGLKVERIKKTIDVRLLNCMEGLMMLKKEYL